jgi:hypothetical protein
MYGPERFRNLFIRILTPPPRPQFPGYTLQKEYHSSAVIGPTNPEKSWFKAQFRLLVAGNSRVCLDTVSSAPKRSDAEFAT